MVEISPKTTAIILAGGSGIRFGMEKPKQFMKVAGKTIIEHTLDVFEHCAFVDEIFVVVNPEWYEYFLELFKKNDYKKVKKVLYGGNTRQESSRIGVYATDENVRYVLIHDAVRPFVTKNIIVRIIEALKTYPAVDTVIPTADTIVRIKDDDEIEEIPPRDKLKRGQTPQGFWRDVILKAHQMAEKEGKNNFPDDCSLVLEYKLGPVKTVAGDVNNIKITYQSDIYLADRLFQLKRTVLSFSNKNYLLHSLKKLKGKTIVIFGGSSGIGEKIYTLVKRYGGIPYSFSRRNGIDITNFENVVSALEKVNEKDEKIDTIINTAGILKMGFLKNMNLTDIHQIIDTNYYGMVNVAKASIPYLQTTRGHLVLFTSSSYTRGREGYSIYSSTKAAVVNLMQALADEVHELGIKVNAICPERTATPMRFKNFGKEPLETLLKPETVAYVTLLLITTEITGQVIDVRKNREERILSQIGLIS